MSRFSSFIAKAQRFLLGGIAGLILGGIGLAAAIPVLMAAFWIWGPFWCVTLVQQRIHDVAGFDFEISKRFNCDAAIGVLVSKPGEAKKALLFEFPPPDDGALPTAPAFLYDARAALF